MSRCSPSREDREEGRLRLDLFLKRTRLVKRRSLAATLCENGWVWLNGKEAPPGKGVRPGDRLTVRYPREEVTVEVLALPGKSGGEGCIRELERRKVEEF